MTWRPGASWLLPTGPEAPVRLRFDETPQPDAAVGAFLPDSGRNIVSVGAGLDWLDVAFSWITYDRLGPD